MAKIDVDIKSTLDKAGFDATAKAVKQLQSEVDGASNNFDKFDQFLLLQYHYMQ